MESLFLALDIVTAGIDIAYPNKDSLSNPSDKERLFFQNIYTNIEIAQNLVSNDIATENDYNPYKLEIKKQILIWLRNEHCSNMLLLPNYTFQQHINFKSFDTWVEEQSAEGMRILWTAGLILFVGFIIIAGIILG